MRKRALLLDRLQVAPSRSTPIPPAVSFPSALPSLPSQTTMGSYEKIPMSPLSPSSPSSSAFLSPLPTSPTPGATKSDFFLHGKHGQTSRYDSVRSLSPADLYRARELISSPLPPRSQTSGLDDRAVVRTQAARAFAHRQFLGFLALVLILFFTFLHTFNTSSVPSLSRRPLASPLRLHPTLVAPRADAPDGKALYQACTVDEVVASLKTAVIREDGLSRFPNFTKQESARMPEFEWSFEFGRLESGKTCQKLRYYGPDEACKLLSAFGGCVFLPFLLSVLPAHSQFTLLSVFTTGDSYSRHIMTSLLILLRGRTDGAVIDYHQDDNCRQDMMFEDGGACRYKIWVDTHEQKEVCGGQASLGFIQTCVALSLLTLVSLLLPKSTPSRDFALTYSCAAATCRTREPPTSVVMPALD
jgi:hypothetical protein